MPQAHAHHHRGHKLDHADAGDMPLGDGQPSAPSAGGITDLN